jgi:hypothetical protein
MSDFLTKMSTLDNSTVAISAAVFIAIVFICLIGLIVYKLLKNSDSTKEIEVTATPSVSAFAASATVPVATATTAAVIPVPDAANFHPMKNGLRDNFCLDVSGVSKDNAANIYAWDCLGADNQNFAQDSIGRLVIKHSGKCVAIDGTVSSGSNVYQYDCNTDVGQKWKIDNGTIKTNDGTLCMDVLNSGVINGSDVRLATCTGAANQKWTVAAA